MYKKIDAVNVDDLEAFSFDTRGNYVNELNDEHIAKLCVSNNENHYPIEDIIEVFTQGNWFFIRNFECKYLFLLRHSKGRYYIFNRRRKQITFDEMKKQ
jgi:hypothetical protein